MRNSGWWWNALLWPWRCCGCCLCIAHTIGFYAPFRFETFQLFKKPWVWARGWPSRFHQGKRIIERLSFRGHQVSNDDRGWPRDSRIAVNQHNSFLRGKKRETSLMPVEWRHTQKHFSPVWTKKGINSSTEGLDILKNFLKCSGIFILFFIKPYVSLVISSPKAWDMRCSAALNINPIPSIHTAPVTQDQLHHPVLHGSLIKSSYANHTQWHNYKL